MHAYVAVAALVACLPEQTVSTRTSPPWNMQSLSVAPKIYPAPGFETEGLTPLFFEGLPWEGKPTRVFAWYGKPRLKPGEKVPAMVLVHGGGGTAFESWVRLWVERGYAAIAIKMGKAVMMAPIQTKISVPAKPRARAYTANLVVNAERATVPVTVASG
jgi:hypothetical protein